MRCCAPGCPSEAEISGGDDAADLFHQAVEEGENVIALRDTMVNELERRARCQLRGMAVDPAYQRRGVGRPIFTEVDPWRRKKGMRICGPTPASRRRSFIENMGGRLCPRNSRSDGGAAFQDGANPGQAGGLTDGR